MSTLIIFRYVLLTLTKVFIKVVSHLILNNFLATLILTLIVKLYSACSINQATNLKSQIKSLYILYKSKINHVTMPELYDIRTLSINNINNSELHGSIICNDFLPSDN